jgi:hypothetical protein
MEPTLRALTGKAEIRAAFERLRARLREGAQAFERSVGYQGGADRFTVYWRPAEGIWCLLDEEYAETRYWCCYGTADPRGASMLSITCECAFKTPR